MRSPTRRRLLSSGLGLALLAAIMTSSPRAEAQGFHPPGVDVLGVAIGAAMTGFTVPPLLANLHMLSENKTRLGWPIVGLAAGTLNMGIGYGFALADGDTGEASAKRALAYTNLGIGAANLVAASVVLVRRWRGTEASTEPAPAVARWHLAPLVSARRGERVYGAVLSVGR